jgi:hypothetical protein
MDTARCRCPLDCAGVRISIRPECPIHGFNGIVPSVAYVLTYQDKQFLRKSGIDPEDGADIADVYRSDLKERR